MPGTPGVFRGRRPAPQQSTGVDNIRTRQTGTGAGPDQGSKLSDISNLKAKWAELRFVLFGLQALSTRKQEYKAKVEENDDLKKGLDLKTAELESL